ncbi:MAG: hypothetical protein STSR0009_19850 [Methanoregula sp.]
MGSPPPDPDIIDHPIEGYCCGSNCTSSPPVLKDAYCIDNAIIRWALYGTLSESSRQNLSNCKYKDDNGNLVNVISPVQYNLPVYPTLVDGIGHDVAVQFRNPPPFPGSNQEKDVRNWKFFQYDNLDIPVGNDPQIPKSSEIPSPCQEYKLVIYDVEDVVCDESGLHIKRKARTTFMVDTQGVASYHDNFPDDEIPTWYPPL